jgi:hypothetical protein
MREELKYIALDDQYAESHAKEFVFGFIDIRSAAVAISTTIMYSGFE